MLFNMGKAYEPDNSPFHIEHIDSIILTKSELKRKLNDPETLYECVVSTYSFLVLVIYYLIRINFC